MAGEDAHSAALEAEIVIFEGGARTWLDPSERLRTTFLLAFAKAGDHTLVIDSVYLPARKMCDGAATVRSRDHLLRSHGSGIAQLVRPSARLVFTESPGLLTFEIPGRPRHCCCGACTRCPEAEATVVSETRSRQPQKVGAGASCKQEPR
jgi:cystathionine beta-lyase/cystathionine gamma-synthase